MKKQFDEGRIIELYKKYGTLNRAALSADCSPSTVKKVLVKNGIPINPYRAPRWNYNSIRN